MYREIFKSALVYLKLYQALFICKNIAADDDGYLGWSWSKGLTFLYKKADFSAIVNILVKTL